MITIFSNCKITRCFTDYENALSHLVVCLNDGDEITYVNEHCAMDTDDVLTHGLVEQVITYIGDDADYHYVVAVDQLTGL